MSFRSVVDDMRHRAARGSLYPSDLDGLLDELERCHERELQEAMRGFLEEGFGDMLDADVVSWNSIKAHARECDRRDLMRRLTKYFDEPHMDDPDVPFDGGVVDYSVVRSIVMHPSDGWTANDFYWRLMYLLGDDLEGKHEGE